jgi:hypothetical protein
MNYIEAPINLLLDTGRKPTDKVVLLYLLWRQGKNESCWPAIRTISKELGLSRDTVQKSLERLNKTGSVSISTPEKRGRGYKNSYTVNGLNFRTIKDGNGLKNRTIQSNKWPEKQATNGLKSRTELTPTTNTIKEKTTEFSFSFENKSFEGILPEDMARWSAAYPAVDIQGDIRRAAEWLLANPDKRKRNCRRFLTNWFARTQEKGGSKGDFNGRNRNSKVGTDNAGLNPVARPGEFVR